MLGRILRKIRFLFALPQITKANTSKKTGEPLLSSSLEDNLKSLQDHFGGSADFRIRRLFIGPGKGVPSALVYIDGIIDDRIINSDIVRPLLDVNGWEGFEAWDGELLEYIHTRRVTTGYIDRSDTLNGVIEKIVNGYALLMVDGFKDALIFKSQGGERRGITEPDTEITIKGPREGFVEDITVNIGLLRRYIRNADLIVEHMKLGARTGTNLVIAYIKGLANEQLVNEVRRRISRIDIDIIISAGFVEQLIEDAPLSPFSTVGNNEKPDVVAAKMLEGRVAIFTDGGPMVLTVPYLFFESFQVPDDYYTSPIYATFLRWFRYLSYIISILTPGLYVAMIAFHHELIPTPLLVTIAAARARSPFPAIVEVLGMGLIFEILREAGVRMPKAFGQAVSIVGALVIGESAVSAGLIGAPMVIIVAITAISSFVIPPQADSSLFLRTLYTFVAAVLGVFGIAVALLLTLIHLTTLRSFGVPYLSPVAPLTQRDLKDVVVRAPIWMMITRPKVLNRGDSVRQRLGLMPSPYTDEDEGDANVDE